jgi:hypothetical protein
MMSKMVLDEATSARLLALGDRVELCDKSGRTLGFFVPATESNPRVFSPISDEELDRRSREPGGRTLAEIWTSLGRS